MLIGSNRSLTSDRTASIAHSDDREAKLGYAVRRVGDVEFLESTNRFAEVVLLQIL